MQQSRKFYNERNLDKITPSTFLFFYNLKSYRNKGRARQVPAAAVTPAPQMEINLNGSKISVVVKISHLRNLLS